MSEYRGRIKHIEIDEVDNGFVVHVGCRALVFAGDTPTERASFVDKLREYVLEPERVEEDWLKAHGLPIAAHELDVTARMPAMSELSAGVAVHGGGGLNRPEPGYMGVEPRRR